MIKSEHHRTHSSLAKEIQSSLSSSLKQCLEVAVEKGASTWLTVLPLKCHGFALHKGDFCDALCLRYGWLPPHLSSHCVCGSEFTVEHTLQCKHGGFPSMRHNEVRDITAHLLTETSHGRTISTGIDRGVTTSSVSQHRGRR